MTYTEFLRRFPDNDACLDYLKERIDVWTRNGRVVKVAYLG